MSEEDEMPIIILIERIGPRSIKVSVGKKTAKLEMSKGVTPRRALLNAVEKADIYQHLGTSLQEFMDNTRPRYESRAEAKRDLSEYRREYVKLTRLGLDEHAILTLSKVAEKERKKRK